MFLLLLCEIDAWRCKLSQLIIRRNDLFFHYLPDFSQFFLSQQIGKTFLILLINIFVVGKLVKSLMNFYFLFFVFCCPWTRLKFGLASVRKYYIYFQCIFSYGMRKRKQSILREIRNANHVRAPSTKTIFGKETFLRAHSYHSFLVPLICLSLPLFIHLPHVASCPFTVPTLILYLHVSSFVCVSALFFSRHVFLD